MPTMIRLVLGCIRYCQGGWIVYSGVLWSDAIVLRMDVDVPSKEKVGKTVRAR